MILPSWRTSIRTKHSWRNLCPPGGSKAHFPPDLFPPGIFRMKLPDHSWDFKLVISQKSRFNWKGMILSGWKSWNSAPDAPTGFLGILHFPLLENGRMGHFTERKMLLLPGEMRALIRQKKRKFSICWKPEDKTWIKQILCPQCK